MNKVKRKLSWLFQQKPLTEVDLRLSVQISLLLAVICTFMAFYGLFLVSFQAFLVLLSIVSFYVVLALYDEYMANNLKAEKNHKLLKRLAEVSSE